MPGPTFQLDTTRDAEHGQVPHDEGFTTMGDTTVTVETEEPEEGSTEETTEETSTDGAEVKATHVAIESKAHAEHSASEASVAANKAETHANDANWAAKNSQEALQAITQLSESVLGAIQEIPNAVASALAGLQKETEPTLTVESDEPITPATPPRRRKFSDLYYGNGKK